MPEAQTAKLETAHVATLRIYTTAAYQLINGPLRTAWANHSHPLPVTVSFLGEAIFKLRAVGASAADANAVIDLWRGMKDRMVSGDFMQNGGTELAPMSTTSTLKVALEYSEATDSLLFKLRTDGFMGRGASVRFLSAFPGEDETLFPPLTYLKPTGKRERVECATRTLTVVEVVPHFGSA